MTDLRAVPKNRREKWKGEAIRFSPLTFSLLLDRHLDTVFGVWQSLTLKFHEKRSKGQVVSLFFSGARSSDAN
jgi:hypothetical protein